MRQRFKECFTSCKILKMFVIICVFLSPSEFSCTISSNFSPSRAKLKIKVRNKTVNVHS